MSKPPSWTSREELLLLLNAYLDNELDAASVLDVERRITADPTLKAEYDRLSDLRKALAGHLTKERASDDFRARIAAIAAAPKPVAARRMSFAHRFEWRQMAAAVAVAAVLASGTTYLGVQQAGNSSDIASIVAGHQRALLASQPFDVASSDRHTVKPWFDSKLALSPLVLDLSSDGFQLVGGRADVVDGKAVPAMVYKRRAHVISLVAVPKPGSRDTGAPPARTSRDGYSALTWPGADFEYSAVSDVADADLSDFVANWRKAASSK